MPPARVGQASSGMRVFLVSLLLTLAAIAKPTLWIIGDSTVRNGTAGQMGWGDPLVAEFDPASIEVVNRAIGGRSSRTFLTEGRWDAVLANIREGDFVLIQFGHNDGGEKFTSDRPRASLRGTGEETETGVVEMTGVEETVHSFGWYLRHYCETAKSKGAHPVVVSLIPRNKRDDQGRILRNTTNYGGWAKEAAAAENVPFIDFNEILATRYDQLGKEGTDALFAAPDHTHTSPAGAAFNAAVLAGEIRKLEGCGLKDHLRDADCWLPQVFSDHMVLQRDAPIPIWGRTRAGSEISVSLAGETARTTANASGHWLVELPALPAGGPHTLTVKAATERKFSDVMIGEVWLCSGQSNMDFTVAPTDKRPFSGTTNWKHEVAAGDAPAIRMFTAEWTMRELPQPDVEGTWRVASPETVPDFSAVAWFFGRDLHGELKVPVGLITCAFGASTAEAWISEERLASEPDLVPLLKDYERKKIHFRDHPELFTKYGEDRSKWRAGGSEGRPPHHPNPVMDQHNPGVLFNGMLHPVIPFGIRGAIWYQGESNVGTRDLYPALQRTLIEDWRSRWGRGEFPFLFVQLASHNQASRQPAESPLATMRAAQATSLSLPHTGMAVAIDIGDAKDIHPRNKQDVAHRLARLALAHTYARSIEPCGPTMKKATVENGAIRVTFDHVAEGLIAKGGELRHFAIAGTDRKFIWADATIAGDSVVVRHPSIPEPAYVRYAWADNPASANLCNSEGLPAAPFRTDL